MAFPPAYCLFSFLCFVSNKPTTELLNIIDPKGNPLDCPKSCLCYRAPKDHFGIEDTSNSMICEGEQVKLFYQHFGPNQPKRQEIKLNTIVLKDLKNLKEKTIVLNADSVVFENVPNLKDLTLEGNFRYLIINAQNELKHLPEVKSQELRGIYILESGDKDDTQFIPPAQAFPKLESFTIQQSHFQSFNSRRFISAPTLKTLDLSHNQLISVDCITAANPNERNFALTSLYLNDNFLATIPTGLKYTFPNLKTLHLHRNQIKIIDYAAIQPLFVIQEFVLYQFFEEKTVWEIYNYGQLEQWFPDANTKQIPVPMGLLDPLQHLVITCANEKELTVKYELGMDLASCEKWKFRPEKAYQDKTKFYIGMHRHKNIDLRGPVFDLSRGVSLRMLDKDHNTVWLEFPENYVRTENDYFEFRNFVHFTKLLSYHIIYRFNGIERTMLQKNDLDELQQMLSYVVNAQPNFVGFEIEIFDASFAAISLDKNPPDFECPLQFQPKELKKKFKDRAKAYNEFVTRMSALESHDNKFSFLVTIDAKCLEIAKMFLQDISVTECFGNDVRIDGIHVVNIDIEAADYQKHKALITEFESSYTKVTFKEVHSGQKDQLKMVSMAEKLS